MPKWEDPANDAGGKWVLQSSPNRRGALDAIWINTVLTVIGEGFEAKESDDICGVVLNIRRSNDKISIWTRSALNQELTEAIGDRWRKAAATKAKLSYMVHKEAMAKNSSFGNTARYTF